MPLRAETTRGISLLTAGVLIVGIILLLNNFLLLGDFNVWALWPLLLVVAGGRILLKGDLTDSAQGRTFGITRGTVEACTIEVSAGEIDVQVNGLAREGRLAAGEFARDSRPVLDVRDTQAILRLDRSATPWLAFNDWRISLAKDLPWQVLITTHLGQVSVDLSDVIVQDAVIATGLGDIRLTTPREAFGALNVQSAVGDIHIYVPDEVRAVIQIERTLLSRVYSDPDRYTEAASGQYKTTWGSSSLPPIEIRLRSAFGDVYLA